jgi:hypothetical protein
LSFLAPHILDLANGSFEFVGAYGAWRNAYQLYKDKQIKGVYYPIYFFYCAWGLFNLFYYPSLHQWFSTAAGAILVLGNLAWVLLSLKLKYGNSKNKN